MKISIIIPTIGRKTLIKTLRSIKKSKGFSSKKTEVEVIVVGDGNLSREKILGKSREFESVIFTNTLKKKGVSVARNIGIDLATGEILAFIGDDIYLGRNWVKETRNFHSKNPQKHMASLGKIDWVYRFRDKPLYKWLNNWAQFSYYKIRLHGANWSNFYTSNVSLKRDFLEKDRFFTEFNGWGFEDTELGYRLFRKGMNLVYNPKCIVYHDHRQSIEGICKNFRNARQNAKIFEKIHPELKILPRGNKLKILRIMIKVAKFFAPFIPEARWWYRWKEAWIKEN